MEKNLYAKITHSLTDDIQKFLSESSSRGLVFEETILRIRRKQFKTFVFEEDNVSK